MGYDGDTQTGHGFRTSARTLIHEHLKFSPDAIEAQLAHTVPDRPTIAQHTLKNGLR